MEIKKTIQALTRSVMAIVMFVTASNTYISETKASTVPVIDIRETNQPKTEHRLFYRKDLKSIVTILPTSVVENLTLTKIKELKCMALNNYFEAATEGIRGMQAVSQVVMNRTGEDGFPRTPCEVIYQKKQFSWTFQKSLPKLDTDSDEWKNAVHVAKQMYIDGHQVKGLEDALYYHAYYVNPRWARVIKLKKIGAHIFYAKTA